MTRLYWDSCVFISRIQRDPERIAVLECLTDEAQRGTFEIVTSALALAEVRYINKAIDEKTRLAHIQAIEAFFDHEYIHIVQVTAEIARAAARLGHQHGMKVLDSIHVATALARRADVLHTYDHRWLSRDGLIGTPPLRIRQPAIDVPQSLPFEAPQAHAPHSIRATKGPSVSLPRRRGALICDGRWIPIDRPFGVSLPWYGRVRRKPAPSSRVADEPLPD
jgi:predicted nucleic acid-binding protein